MTEPANPALTPRALQALQERHAREAAALRQNLRRRKQRMQALEPPPPSRVDEAPEEP